MGQKVNPIANRLGIIRGWDSNWFGGKDFSEKLVEDAKIRKYLIFLWTMFQSNVSMIYVNGRLSIRQKQIVSLSSLMEPINWR